MPGYTCGLGDFMDPRDGQIIDQIIITRFKAPHSYTGEDVVEISCHGGSAIKQAILESLFSLGVSPAEAGEFTRRAFVNGKMDLAQAEAVMDLIQSGARKSSQAAAAQLHGVLSRRVREMSNAVYSLLAQVELILEYPEHEETAEAMEGLAKGINAVRQTLVELSASFRQGRLLREGMTVVIAGRPNAGKSSLLNSLAGFDRAIVTAIPGTTRDTVEELVDIDGLPIRLIDTAGLRETDDIVERLGVDRARNALKSADLIFWLIAPPLANLDEELTGIRQALAEGLPVVLIAAKDDLGESQAVRQFIKANLADQPAVNFSALTGEGLADLRRAIADQYKQIGSTASEEVLITNSRHKMSLDLATNSLGQAAIAMAENIPLDLIASLLRGSADALAMITGDSVSEEVIKTIFARFCIGK